MALLNRVKGLFSKTSKIPSLSAYSVEHEKLDEFILSETRETSRRFEEALTRPVQIERDDGSIETYEQVMNLRSDLFFAHHVGTDDVRMMDRNEVRPSAQMNAEIMQHFIQHPDFLATRPMTRNDEVGAALATMAAQDTLDEEIKTTLKEQAELASNAADEEEKIRRQQEALEGLRQQVRDARANGDPVHPDLIAGIKQAIADREAAKEALQAVAGQMQGMGGQVAEAVAAAAANSKELCEVYVSLPGVGIGKSQRVAPEQAIELAYKWRNAANLKRMAELMGRLERDFRYKRSHRVIGSGLEVVGVELGNDLSRLLPQEMLNLNHPLLKKKFYRDFANRQLLQYETIGHAEAGKGPIVICIDASGSMSGPRNEWARAVALAVSSIAHREKRSVYIIEFEYAVTGEWHLPHRGGLDPEVATDFAMSFSGGGTDITVALKRAKEIIEQHPDFKTADLLLITDGSDHLGEDDLEMREYFTNRGVRIQSVVIGMDTTPYTKAISDDEVAVYDLTGSSGATDRIVVGLT